MKRLLYLFIIIFITGCQKPVYYRDNTSQSEFNKDSFDCAQIAKTPFSGSGTNTTTALGVAGASGIVAKLRADKTYKDCMEVKGYTTSK